MKTHITRVAAALTLAAASAAPAMAQQAEGPWLVRVRAVNIDPANQDNTGLDLSINSKVIPELDISYFFTPQHCGRAGPDLSAKTHRAFGCPGV